MTTATDGGDHKQPQVANDGLFIAKIMEDDKTHFIQVERSFSQVFFVLLFFHISSIICLWLFSVTTQCTRSVFF